MPPKYPVFLIKDKLKYVIAYRFLKISSNNRFLRIKNKINMVLIITFSL